MMKRVLLFIAMLASVFVIPSCQTYDDPTAREQSRSSSMPWSRQESWEGNPYGNMFPNSR